MFDYKMFIYQCVQVKCENNMNSSFLQSRVFSILFFIIYLFPETSADKVPVSIGQSVIVSQANQSVKISTSVFLRLN